MRRALFPWVVLWTTSLFLPPLFAGEINGTVVDQNGIMVEGSEIVLIHASGQKYQAITDYWGAFSFPGLSAGFYDLSLTPEKGTIIVSPSCASFSVALSETETRNFSFLVDSPGVSVDFGRPAGGGTNLLLPVIPKAEGEPFRFVMNIHELRNLSQVPDRFEMEATLPISHPRVSVEIDQVVLGSGFNNSQQVNVSSFQSSAGLLSVEVIGNQDTFRETEGEVLVFYGRVLSPMDNWLEITGNRLCLCVDSLTFHLGSQQINDPPLEKYAEPWSTCFQVASP